MSTLLLLCRPAVYTVEEQLSGTHIHTKVIKLVTVRATSDAAGSLTT